ncbi:MAG: type II secretion system F family protein [Candidatus Omnitrophota bacterium]
MPTYRYKAKKGATETVAGTLEARHQEEAIDIVHRLGLIPISVEECSKTSARKSFGRPQRVRPREIYLFSRQLANLLKAGIPLLRALSLLANQTHNVYFQGVIQSVVSRVKDGENFSQCLAIYPNIFSGLYIAMIRAGEEGGNLREMLLRISEYLQKQEEISGKVRAAIAYPAFMAIVGCATVIFILTFVMPRLTNIFASMQQQLPLATQILINLSNLIRRGWPVISVVLIVGLVSVSRWAKSKSGRVLLSRLKLRLPLLGDIISKSEIVRFSRTLELLIKSGVPLVRALTISIPTLNNGFIQEGLLPCREDLEKGLSLGESLRKTDLFPVLVCDMIKIGEESGSLEESLGDVADSYEQEANEKIRTVTALLEPVMILIVGSVVGFMVIAMLLPIFQMDILAQ